MDFALFDALANETSKLKARVAALEHPALAEFEGDVGRIRTATARFASLIVEERATLAEHVDRDTLDDEEVARVRHDLRAQLGAVKGYGELVLEELEDADTGDRVLLTMLREVISFATALLPTVDAIRIGSHPPSRRRTPAPLGAKLFSSDIEVEYEPQFHGRVVLAIDDSEVNRDILARRLRRTGLEVLTASSGQEGLDVLEQRHVDLVLCDIRMPQMSGPEVLRRLRGQPHTAQIPVLVISAVSEIDVIAECLELGAEDFLSTPFNPILLHARIKGCLSKKIMRDLEEEHLVALDAARAELESAIEAIEDGFAVFDADARLSRCNGKFRELYPAVSTFELPVSLRDLLVRSRELQTFFAERRSVASRPPGEQLEDWLRLQLARHRQTRPYMERLADGRWIEVHNHRMPGGGVVSVHKDVTQRKKDEERLRYLALHDPLTGLANRKAFEAALDEAFANTPRFALLFLDLDGFKGVNDTLGHQVGDELLRHVAATLREQVRDRDVVARLGGDEFAVLLRSEADREVVRVVAERIVRSLGDRWTHGDESVPFGASMGVSLYPEHGGDRDAFVEKADAAMYEAKRAGKGRVRFAG